MSERFEFVVRAVLIGVGATMVMDVWALVLRQFGVPSLNFAFLGRWVGHLTHGQWLHAGIAKSPPVRGELVLGWLAHYSIGVSFAALLLAAFGLDWARTPSLAPALFIGIVTVVAPLFILQPALGAGGEVALDAPRLVHQLLLRREGLLGLRQEPLAFARQQHAARRALEERQPECVFERLDVRADRGLAQVQQLGRARDAALPRDDDERPELVEVHRVSRRARARTRRCTRPPRADQSRARGSPRSPRDC